MGRLVSFTSLLLYPQGDSPTPTPFPLCRTLDGPQSRCIRYGEEKNFLPLLGIESQHLGRQGPSLVAIPTEPADCIYQVPFPERLFSLGWIVFIHAWTGVFCYTLSNFIRERYFLSFEKFLCIWSQSLFSGVLVVQVFWICLRNINSFAYLL
jgi:hypothetical protein